jgi:hypothetical protein
MSDDSKGPGRLIWWLLGAVGIVLVAMLVLILIAR